MTAGNDCDDELAVLDLVNDAAIAYTDASGIAPLILTDKMAMLHQWL